MTLVGIVCVCLSSLGYMATIREIVIDCSDADAMATFWREPLSLNMLARPVVIGPSMIHRVDQS